MSWVSTRGLMCWVSTRGLMCWVSTRGLICWLSIKCLLVSTSGLWCPVFILEALYTSEVIQFRSGFNLDWTRFVPSTLTPVLIETILNPFESIHFAMWFWSGSNWIANHWRWVHVTQLRVTCFGNGWSGVEEQRNPYIAYSLGQRPSTTCHQRIQVE